MLLHFWSEEQHKVKVIKRVSHIRLQLLEFENGFEKDDFHVYNLDSLTVRYS